MKLNKVNLAKAEQLYASGKNFKEVAQALSEKFGIAISPEGIRKRFVRLNLPRRKNSEALVLAKRKHLPIDTIIKLYINKKISLSKLAKQFKSSKNTLHKIICENNIKIRDNDAAIRLANLKYKRNNFNEILEEKAYLLGLVEGDITTFRKSKHTIRAITNTTHSDFLQMFAASFRNYGKIRIYPCKNKTFENYMWCVSVDIDNSFDFLLPENRKNLIPQIINSDPRIFFAFLAGYFDAEGTLYVKKVRENLQYCLKFGTENIDLLTRIKLRLAKFNFKPLVYKNFSKNFSRFANKTKITYNKDYFALEIFRKADIISLLKSLQLKHPEKIAKKKLVLTMINKKFTKWHQAEPAINQLNAEIKKRTLDSIAQAKRLYDAR